MIHSKYGNYGNYGKHESSNIVYMESNLSVGTVVDEQCLPK